MLVPRRSHDLDHDPIVVFQRGGTHHRANRVDISAATADDLPHIIRGQRDLDPVGPLPLDHRHAHLVGLRHHRLDDVAHQVGVVVHRYAPSEALAAGGVAPGSAAPVLAAAAATSAF